uniref:Tc1-like transposase DDE domain-containing protein n=1 Tax=Oncorhynchus tshawytscha TaxID=74940 RepID=A0AAZ3PEN6_ONCTS
RLTFQQDNDTRHTVKTAQEWLWDKSLNVLEWPSQSPDLNPIEHLWRDLKISVQRHSPSDLTELERICREELEKLPKYREFCIPAAPNLFRSGNHQITEESWRTAFQGTVINQSLEMFS